MKTAIMTGLVAIAMLAVPASAESETYSCHVIAGTMVLGAGVSWDTYAGNLGGCKLTEASIAGTVDVSAMPEFCEANIDSDGDGIFDTSLETGDSVASGTAITGFCDVGAVDADLSITVTPAA